MHILSAEQFLDPAALEEIFRDADALASEDAAGSIPMYCAGKILATVFYEPSTRTRFSFEAGMLKLGGQVITTESAANFSSAIKGETLEDSIRVIGGFADAIVLRHPEQGAAERAAKVSTVPIVNGGDGPGEHPTQALYDLYTIRKELGSLDGLTVAMVGDMLNGRTVHSLLPLFAAHTRNKLVFVAPARLALPERYAAYLKAHGVEFETTEDLGGVLDRADVFYVTRVQKERFADPAEYERLKNFYVINGASLARMKTRSIIMHPLPRVGEIAPEVDADPRAAYFRQAKNGLYVRMALLKKVLAPAGKPLESLSKAA